MVHIGQSKAINSINIENNSLVKIKNIHELFEMDCGDEDCKKMITFVDKCDIIIDASVADKFNDVDQISSIRYEYYHPAYNIGSKDQIKEIDENGDIVFHIGKEKYIDQEETKEINNEEIEEDYNI